MADDQQPGLDPQDRDAMIRTVLTEADSNDPSGWAAVASTIRNRLATGKYGDNPTAVVTAPDQFEVWQNGRAQAITPRHPNYEAAGRIVDAVASGLPDTTGGATHFYSPGGQAVLGRQPPAWRKQPLTAIGGNTFFAPHGKVTFQDAPAPKAIEAVTSGKPVASQDDDEFLRQWGVDPKKIGSAPAAASSPQAASPLSKEDEGFLKQWGVDPAKIQQPAPAGQKSGSTAIPPGDTAAAIGSGIGDLPVVGPYIKEGMIKGAAAIGSVVNPVLGLPAPSADEIRQWDAQLKEEHPYGYGAGRVLGAAPLLAGGAALGAGRVLGMTGNMLPRVLYGTASGGAIGAGDAYTHGDNMLVGGALGAAGGFAAPAIGELAGMGVAKLGQGVQYLMPSGVKGVSRSAADMVNKLIDYDGGHAEVRNALTDLGERGMIADTGPSTTAMTAGLASGEPNAAKSTIVNSLGERQAGSNQRIADQLRESLGPAEDAQKVTDAIKAARQAQGNAYTEIHARAPAVDAQSVADAIDAKLPTATGSQKTALQNLRKELVEVPRKPATATDAEVPEQLVNNSEKLHNIRKDLDSVIDYGSPGLGVEKGAVSGNQAALRDVRGALDDTLKSQVPGMAEADAKSALLAKRIEAVQRGNEDVLGAAGPHPETYAETRAAQAPGENIAENKGITSRIDRTFGYGQQRDLAKLNRLIGGGDDNGYNVQNLKTAFGEEPVNKLLALKNQELTFTNTYNKAAEGSKTGSVQAVRDMMKATEPGTLNLTGMTTMGMTAQAAKSMLVNPLIKAVLSNPTAPRNLEIARMLTAQGRMPVILLDQLERLAARQGGVSNTADFLTGLTRGVANPLLQGAGMTQRPGASQ
jgi:hypothetical protein